jgi:hypothetical protein
LHIGDSSTFSLGARISLPRGCINSGFSKGKIRTILIYLSEQINNINLKRKRATARVDFNKEGMVKHWTKASHGKGRS